MRSVLFFPLLLSTPLLLPAQERTSPAPAQPPAANAAANPAVNLDRAGALYIEGRFRKLDKDNDGKLTAEEAQPVEFFVKGADANADGLYTLDEVQTHMRKQSAQIIQKSPVDALAALGAAEMTERFKQLDKDGDGKLVGEELATARWLTRMDRNGDGAVTQEEVNSTLATLLNNEAPPAEGEVPPPFVPDESSPRQQPKQITASQAGVHRMIPDVTFADLDGKQHRLSDFTKRKATVIALMSPSCPVSKRFLPTLAALESESKAADVSLLLVAPTATDTPEVLKAALASAKLTATCVPDPTGTLSQLLAGGTPATSTDAFVLDARRTVVYRGAVDDQYGLGYSLDAPRHRYVADAVRAVLSGGTPAVEATEAPGCVLDFAKTQAIATAKELTYHGRVSRIIQANCQDCHRSGGVAPFPLETPEQVAAKAGMMRRMVERKLMPPWFASPTPAGQHSPWSNDRSLTEQDRTDLLAWLGSGRPLGDPKDAPLPRQYPGEWAIGTPDAIYQIAEPIAVKATGTMPYQNVKVETGLTEDKWITAIEVKPTAREVVHHVLIFVREPGSRRGDDGAPRIAPDDDGRGGFFAAYVPGNDHVIYPPAFAKVLPAGAQLRFQIHYTPNGTATTDQIRIGVRFGKQAPQHVVQVAGIADTRLNIPPGADNHPETGALPVPREVKILGYMPHMHVRGKAFRYDVILPDGTAKMLLNVPRYDFNWQLAYRYNDPITIPAGSKLRATGWFDNSANNPANPDPTKAVRWGPQTYDEMMLGYVEYYYTSAPPKVAAAQ